MQPLYSFEVLPIHQILVACVLDSTQSPWIFLQVLGYKLAGIF